jgi:NAD+ diphosphatase
MHVSRMQPSAPDHPAYFSTPGLDRLSARRHDPSWLAAALHAAGTRFVPVCGSHNICSWRDGAPHAFLLDAEAARALLPLAHSVILLGSSGELNYFALELPAETPLSGGQPMDLRQTSPLLGATELALLGYARAMTHWHSQHRHCGRCGAPTVSARAGHERICPDCDARSFPRLDPAIIVLVTDGGRCLLGRQKSWPAYRYSTLAGFVEPGETLEIAVQREVLEETDVRVQLPRYRSSQPWPFPGSLMLGFRAEALSTAIHCNDAELEDAAWFSRDSIAADMAAGTLLLPPSRSISYRLIREWYEEDARYRFDELPYVDPFLAKA